MFIIFRPIPFVDGMTHYILPLAYLHWIGLGLIAIAIWMFLAGMMKSGRYKYIRHGEPFVGRILHVDAMEAGTQEVPQFRFYAVIDYRHPETDELQQATVVAEDQWNHSELEKHSCTLEKGEYVTLVSLPGKVDKTLKIFGFLGLDPEREYLLKNSKPLKGVSPFTATMIAFLIAGVVLIIMAFFDVVMFSWPTGGDWKLPVGLAVVARLQQAGYQIELQE